MTPEQRAAKIARQVIAAEVATALRAFYGTRALIEVHESNTGLQQLHLQLRDGPTYNLTLTKARTR